MVIPLRDENPTRRTPVLTILLIAANVFVFLFLEPAGLKGAVNEFDGGETNSFLYANAMVPCEVTHQERISGELATECSGPQAALELGLLPGDPSPAFPEKNVLFSMLASMFLHAGWLHIGGNMLFLWIFGNNIEDRFGPILFVLFYVATGVAAALAHVLVGPESIEPVVGASGAVAGVMGAYLVWFPQARILSIVPIFFFIQFIRLPAAVVLGLWFVLQFFTNPNSGVAWAAHVGGFVAGALVALVMGRPARHEYRRESSY